MFVIRNRYIFFAISGLLVLASIIAISIWGLQPGVDFTGGSIVEVRYASSTPSTDAVSAALAAQGFEDVLVRVAEDNTLNIRMEALGEGDRDKVTAALGSVSSSTLEIRRLSSVGPTIGQELRRKTIIAIILVVLMIILYVAFAFRKVGGARTRKGESIGVSSWVYGFVAIITLLHDIIIPTGVFAFLGKFGGLEADTLFVVAILTILGLSVNDTIVVFDRIRENLRVNQERGVVEGFDETVGHSLEQTYVRSFNTSFTVILVLLILFFLGGPTIHTFMLTMLVGQVAGTYSSIFIASPLLVVWERMTKKKDR